MIVAYDGHNFPLQQNISSWHFEECFLACQIHVFVFSLILFEPSSRGLKNELKAASVEMSMRLYSSITPSLNISIRSMFVNICFPAGS